MKKGFLVALFLSCIFLAFANPKPNNINEAFFVAREEFDIPCGIISPEKDNPILENTVMISNFYNIVLILYKDENYCEIRVKSNYFQEGMENDYTEEGYIAPEDFAKKMMQCLNSETPEDLREKIDFYFE